MSELREAGRVTVTGRIELLSGLHIGAGKDSVEIGGVDNAVIKHPHTGEPYIPGSSIKGRLRFLLEWAFGKVRTEGLPWGSDNRAENATVDAADPILRTFGNALKDWRAGPTRLLVRDAPLNREWRDAMLESGLELTETKTEVVIDRISGKAHDRIGPRQTERVPSGASFKFAMAFRLFDTGDDGERDIACLNWTLLGLDLLEQDALGGSGSRGYGRIRFENLELTPLGGKPVPLDNRFRGQTFDRDRAPDIWRPT
jgi:CRISPR-associated protein Csm3